MIVNYKPAYVLYRQYPGNKDFELNKPFELEKWPGGFQIVFKDCQGERHYSEEFFKMYPYLFTMLNNESNTSSQTLTQIEQDKKQTL